MIGIDLMSGRAILLDQKDVEVELTPWADNRYVNILGDLMTGNLGIQPSVDSLTALYVNDKDGNNVLTVDTVNNRVGIGTTNPTEKLHVYDASDSSIVLGRAGSPSLISEWSYNSGIVSFGSRSSDALQLVYNNTQNLLINGSGVAVANNINFNVDSGTFFVNSTSNNVGIGTTNPTSKLQVETTGVGSNYISVRDTRSNTGDNVGIRFGTYDSSALFKSLIGHIETGAYGLGDLIFAVDSNADANSVATTDEKMRITSTGNVGIGTVSPTAKLQINSIASYESATLGSELLSASNWTLGTGWSGDFATGFTHTSGTGTLTNTLAAVVNNYYQIAYTVTGRTAGSFTVAFGGQSYSGRTATGTFGPRATTTGNLIITPTTDFNGTVIISIKQITANYGPTFALNDSAGNTSFEIRNSPISFNNTFIGVNSGRKNTTGINNSSLGNNSLMNNTTGNYNSAQGYSSLYSNTSGSANSAQGAYALYSNTTGNNNSAQGVNALYSNTSGYQNSAQGVYALRYNTTGNNNSAQGYSALQNLTGSYSNNTALGYNAGRYYNGTTGNLTSASNSLFLGASASALANGGSNEIVIGYNAIGNGSNTIKLGNTSITNVASNGDFEALDIGDGFILKSPDGTRYRITVANGGALSAVAV